MISPSKYMPTNRKDFENDAVSITAFYNKVVLFENG